MFGIGVLIARTIWYDSYVSLARNENTKIVLDESNEFYTKGDVK